MKIHPRMATERLRLRPFVADDAEELAKLGSDRSVADTMLDWPHPFSPANARSTIAAQAANYQTGRSLHLALEIQKTPGLIGGIELRGLDAEDGCAELRFWVEAGSWKKGFATEAAMALLRFGFGELRLHRVDALCLARDPAGAAVLGKIGMKQEGLLRERVRKFDCYEDVALYAVLASDGAVRA
ncbi:MAG: GNAT family protein [Myxococcota bacterium]